MIYRAQFLAGATLLLFGAGCREDATAPPDRIDTPEPPSTTEASATEASWELRADYPTNIYAPVSAAYTNPRTLETTLYVIGGGTKQGALAGSLTDAVWAYEMSANRWSPKAKLPVVLTFAHPAVELNGKIYVAGGFSRRWDQKHQVWRLSTSNALYVYDIARDTWTRKADMPGEGVHGVAAAYNGFIYVASQCYGSLCGEDFLGVVLRYNPATDHWNLESRVPNGETWTPAGGIIGGKLYVVDDMGATDIYDPATKQWTTGPQRPFRSCSGTSTTFQAKVYIANCLNEETDGEAMLVLDPKTNTWQQLPAAPEGSYATMARIGVNGINRLELVGGPKIQSNWQYTP